MKTILISKEDIIKLENYTYYNDIENLKKFPNLKIYLGYIDENPKCCSIEGYGPCHIATYHQNIDSLEYLLKVNGYPKSKAPDGIWYVGGDINTMASKNGFNNSKCTINTYLRDEETINTVKHLNDEEGVKIAETMMKVDELQTNLANTKTKLNKIEEEHFKCKEMFQVSAYKYMDFICIHPFYFIGGVAGYHLIKSLFRAYLSWTAKTNWHKLPDLENDYPNNLKIELKKGLRFFIGLVIISISLAHVFKPNANVGEYSEWRYTFYTMVFCSLIDFGKTVYKYLYKELMKKIGW
jgi:hypothetical protein